MKPTIEIYNGSGVVYGIDHLKISEEEGAHDLYTAFVANPNTDSLDKLKGQPAIVSWGTGPTSRKAYGYLDTPTHLDGHGGMTGWAFMVLGSTSVMRSGQTRSFRRTTPFRIARNIVAPYRLALTADQYVSPIDNFIQSEESDWAALNMLARRCGMTVIAGNAGVRMVDVRRELARSQYRTVPTLVEPESFYQMETDSPGGFDRFEFTGIDALGSNFTVRGGPETGVKRHSGRNFASLDEARNAAVERADRDRRMIRAMAKYGGNMSVTCGDIVAAEGQRWFVSKSETVMEFPTGNQTTQLELHRSETFRISSLANELPPEPRLVSGRWVASKRYEVQL